MAMSHSRCIPPHDRIDQVMNEVNNIVITGATYTAGDGIDAAQLALNIIQTSIDGVTIIFDAGVMKAVAASDLVAGCGVDITGGVISASVDGTTAFCVGGNLSSWTPGDGLETSSQTLLVKAHTYIDVTSSGVAVDFTEVADYDAGERQYLCNDNGTFKWVTVTTCP
jgi:hypothetical protein